MRKMATGNTTITDDLRQKLEALAIPGKSADDLANEAVAAFISKREHDHQWVDLVTYGRENGATSGYTDQDVSGLIRQVRRQQ